MKHRIIYKTLDGLKAIEKVNKKEFDFVKTLRIFHRPILKPVVVDSANFEDVYNVYPLPTRAYKIIVEGPNELLALEQE